jgi:phage-related baseplate assembly protein
MDVEYVAGSENRMSKLTMCMARRTMAAASTQIMALVTDGSSRNVILIQRGNNGASVMAALARQHQRNGGVMA